MFGVLLAVTKFQCDRFASYLVHVARRMLRYLLWVLMPKTNIIAVIDGAGNDVCLEVTEKVADNHLIGLDDYPSDLLGSTGMMMMMTRDGRCLRIIDGKGTFEVGVGKVSEIWEPLHGLVGASETPSTVDTTMKDNGSTGRVKDD